MLRKVERRDNHTDQYCFVGQRETQPFIEKIMAIVMRIIMTIRIAIEHHKMYDIGEENRGEN